MFQTFSLGLTTGSLIGFVLHWIFRKEKARVTTTKETIYTKKNTSTPDKSFRLALIINDDLKMTKGKVIAQCGHAAQGVYDSYYETRKSDFETWEEQGKHISVFKVSDSDALKLLNKAATARTIISCLVIDAGRTQIARGSCTVLAIGPEEESNLNQLTEHLLPYM